ncbi:hypothetical protein V496_05528 [Pseudogymnoascus sp. VKM F-4515 (FW-2607)]|nr:hypothetical protein V496_05528 [Pseudogymnoascus sp. VKM F-4515 (FW-2607)]
MQYIHPHAHEQTLEDQGPSRITTFTNTSAPASRYCRCFIFAVGQSLTTAAALLPPHTLTTSRTPSIHPPDLTG